MVAPVFLRWALHGTLIGVALVALLALRRRRLPFGAFVVWGLIVLVAPLVGPFVALLFGPRMPRRCGR